MTQEERDARENTSLFQRIERGLADARDIADVKEIALCKHLTPSMVHHMLNAFCWGKWNKSANDIQRLVRVLRGSVNIKVREDKGRIWEDEDIQDPNARMQVVTLIPSTRIASGLYVDWCESLELLAFKYVEDR